MEEKKHYKLYKSGKLWMTAMISAAVLGSAGIVHADVTSQSSATTTTDTSEVVAKTTDLGKAALTTSQTTESSADQNSNKQESTAPVSSNDQGKKASVENNQNNTQNNTEKTTNPVKEQSSDTVLKNSVSNVANNENKEVKSVTPATSSFATDENIVSQRTVPQANSTITVSNPTDYPTQAAKLVGKNSQGQPYYIYQIVSLFGRSNTTGVAAPAIQVDGRNARMILAIDPANPQGKNYVYITNDQFKRATETYEVASGSYKDIKFRYTGTDNKSKSVTFRVYNTAPQNGYSFNGKKIDLPASLSIRVNSENGVSQGSVYPIYGLGNQHLANYVDKVDITPELNNPAIEYIYRDKNGNFTTNSALPANVPVNGLTGQQFLITNVNNYKQVVKGYYLTNQKDSLANVNGTDYRGTISQFQIGKYYQKTLYDWSGSISQKLIYELINPQGTMDISLVLPNGKTETKRVAVGQHDTFSNGTYARNPFVPGANAVQLVYADLGHIIPVDEKGNVISQDQPIYNNDENDAHNAAATKSPDLTAEGWVLSNPKQATITPANPGEDTKVEYLRVIINTETKTVTQTVKYEYADGVTEGRPSLPTPRVQTATFTHTIITNPVTGKIISDTWTPAKKFDVEYSPKVEGFYADFAYVGGNDNVTQNTPDTTFVVKYAGPNETVEHQTVTQTVHYAYKDGITEGRPALPQDNVQQKSFTHTVKTDPEGNVIEDTWTPDQADNQFTAVKSPNIHDEATDTNYYYDQAVVGGNTNVTQLTPDTEFIVYYLPGNITTQSKSITQTVHYAYRDGVTQGRPALPTDNVQKVTFTQKIETNPFTGDVTGYSWDPIYSKFDSVQTPELKGFYADQEVAGGDTHVIPEDSDTTYTVYYAAPVSKITEEKQVTQTIRYVYKDGITANRPTLPRTDVQTKVFYRTVTTNPWNNKVISDTWTPAQYFTVIKTPEINGFYYDKAQAGNDTEAVTQDSQNTNYVVEYAPAKSEEVEKKDVTQTIRYHYADGVDGNPASLPKNNVQTLTFTRTLVTNPFTNEVISDTWSPAQKFSIVMTPNVPGYYADQAQAGSDAEVTNESPDTTYDVYYLAPDTTENTKNITQTIKYEYADGETANRPALPTDDVQTLTFIETIKRNPITGEIISREWSPAQNFKIVDTPNIPGYYADQAQAGSEAAVNYDDADTEYVVKYAPAKSTTETKEITQTIRYHYANGVEGNPALLPTNNIQSLDFTRTILTNPWTDEVISDTWSPAQKFSIVDTPNIPGYYADQAQAGSDAEVTNESPDTTYDVYYLAPDTIENKKTITQTIKYEYADGETANRPTLPTDDVQSLTFIETIKHNPITGEIISREWSPAQKFSIVDTPNIPGYYADQAQAGSEAAVNYNDADTEYVVKYAPAKSTTETKDVTQIIRYHYADGVDGDLANLPKNDIQTLTFTRTTLINPWTDEVISDTWSPAQKFAIVATPTLKGYYADQNQAGSDAVVTSESPDTTYDVYYLAPDVTENTKTITQTVKYEYADGENANRPALPTDDVQSLTFIETIKRNPITGEIISREWSPAQNFKIVNTPNIPGYYADQAQAGSEAAVNYDDADTEYFVKYAPAKSITETKDVTQTIKYVYVDGVTEGRPALPKTSLQSLTFTRTILTNPWTDEVISDTWSPAQKFSIVKTPNIPGYYADQAQAGSDSAVTHESPDTESTVRYAPGKVTTEDKTVTQTIKYEYADGVTEGRPTLPADNTITVDFTHTIVRDPWTDEVISDTWSPAQTINPVESPTIEGFTPDHAVIPGKTITYDSKNLDYVVKYTKDDETNKPTPEEPTPEEPTTPEPEKPTEPVEETPTPSQPQPTVPVPEAPVQQPTKPVEEPSETPVINQVGSVKPAAPNKEANNKLPQTGNQDSTAIIGLGLVTAFASLFGFGKRKSEE